MNITLLSSSYSTATGKRKVRLPLQGFSRVRFTSEDIPPLEFWTQVAQPPMLADLSAEECYETAQAYVDAAIKNTPGWQERLIVTTNNDSTRTKGKGNRKTMMSAYTLHYIAAMIALRFPDNAMHIATHILFTLTNLDYAPSVLSFARMAIERRMAYGPQFEPVIQKFMHMVQLIDLGNEKEKGKGGSMNSASDDALPDFAADACTLRALLYAAEGTREGDSNALRWFRRAYELGTAAPSSQQPASSSSKTAQHQEEEREQEHDQDDGTNTLDSLTNSGADKGMKFYPHWQWKISFALSVASIRVKRGELEKALAMYQIATSEEELDSEVVNREMAVLLQKMGKGDTAEYRTCLMKAAVSGDREAAKMAAEAERQSSMQEGLSRWEVRKRRVFAEELMAIAQA